MDDASRYGNMGYSITSINSIWSAPNVPSHRHLPASHEHMAEYTSSWL